MDQAEVYNVNTQLMDMTRKLVKPVVTISYRELPNNLYNFNDGETGKTCFNQAHVGLNTQI